MDMTPDEFPTAAYIGGQWVTSEDRFAVVNPATGQEIARVANLTPDDARRAVNAASAATIAKCDLASRIISRAIVAEIHPPPSQKCNRPRLARHAKTKTVAHFGIDVPSPPNALISRVCARSYKLPTSRNSSAATTP